MSSTPETKLNGQIRSDFTQIYEMRKESLGQGGQAEVFLAIPLEDTDPQTGEKLTPVAVKVLFHKPGSKKLPETKVLREVGFLHIAKDHPNLVQLKGIFLIEGVAALGPVPRWGLALEYCPGGDLIERVKKQILSERSAKCLMKGLLAALQFLHGHQVIHRDVKADNILLNALGWPVLADMGIACYMWEESETKHRVGTPGYMAPEVLQRGTYDHKVDLFSSGVVLYVALSGHMPFSGPNLGSTLRRTTRGKVDFKSVGISKRVHVDGMAFILSLLKPKPYDRPDAASALLDPWLVGQLPHAANPLTSQQAEQPRHKKPFPSLSSNSAESMAGSPVPGASSSNIASNSTPEGGPAPSYLDFAVANVDFAGAFGEQSERPRSPEFAMSPLRHHQRRSGDGARVQPALLNDPLDPNHSVRQKGGDATADSVPAQPPPCEFVVAPPKSSSSSIRHRLVHFARRFLPSSWSSRREPGLNDVVPVMPISPPALPCEISVPVRTAAPPEQMNPDRLRQQVMSFEEADLGEAEGGGLRFRFRRRRPPRPQAQDEDLQVLSSRSSGSVDIGLNSAPNSMPATPVLSFRHRTPVHHVEDQLHGLGDALARAQRERQRQDSGSDLGSLLDGL